ncbi:MAG: hypothetical protein EOP42_25480, partial [Sphingobacteriaceae bacterium]
MENENFDEDLKNHIKQVFDNYDDGQANEGWNLLREKYPQKNDRKYFFWWISAAVLLFTFSSIWFFQPKTAHTKSVKNTKPIQSIVTKTPIKPDSSLKKSFVKTNSFNTIVTKKTLIKTVSKLAFKQTPKSRTSIVNSGNTEPNQIKKYNNTVFTDVKLDSVEHKNYQTQTLILTKADSINQKNTQLID